MEHFVPERKVFSQATDKVPSALSNLGIGEMPDDQSDSDREVCLPFVSAQHCDIRRRIPEMVVVQNKTGAI